MTNPSPHVALESLPACTCRSGALTFRVMMLALLMGLLASAVVTYTMPTKYESKAVIQVNQSNIIGGCFPSTNAKNVPLYQIHFSNELEAFRSQKTISEVVHQLNLTARWGISEENALFTLRDMIDVKSIRDTDLIEVTVRHANPQEAREITQEIYEAYKKHNDEWERNRFAEGINELEKAIQDQADVVEEKRNRLDNLLKSALGANEANSDYQEILGKIKEEAANPLTLSQEHADIASSQKEFDTQQEMLDRMREKLAIDRINGKHPLIRIELHEEPLVAKHPYSPNPALNLFIGAGAGLALGLLIVLTMELFQKPCQQCAAA